MLILSLKVFPVEKSTEKNAPLWKYSGFWDALVTLANSSNKIQVAKNRFIFLYVISLQLNIGHSPRVERSFGTNPQQPICDG